MARQSVAYIYGSSARALEREPLRRQEEEIRRRQRPRPKAQPKPRIDKVAVLLTCLTFMAVMVVGIYYLHLQFQSTYLNKSVVDLQSEVVELERENATTEMNLENSLDLRTVYETATKKLGMVAAKDNQVFTYESKKSTQVRQHGTIPED
ncbi:MAG: hypothetical protein J1F22_07960 [Lachnospiraceae bacterium]|nr:hypothetical protein [Lachnospiraceae bacterium]